MTDPASLPARKSPSTTHRRGGAGEALARCLLLKGETPGRFSHFSAQGYLSSYYGSQNFHRKECGLSPEDILKELA